MIEILVLIAFEGEVSEDFLRNVPLQSAKRIVVGSVPGNRWILHVAANSHTDLQNALLTYSEVPDVTHVEILYHNRT